MNQSRDRRLTRRSVLGAGAAVLAANVLPRRASAAGAKFRRWEITDPAMPPRVLDSYKRGIKKMLELPPTDARNWYRNALVHVFDCPHQNWWFLVWHRAYLGWLETTLRDLSQDPEFALPYWDWTKTPSVPAAMFVDVLDPNNGAFVPTFDQFKAQFTPAIASLYASFSQDQKAGLARRPFSVATPDDLWTFVEQQCFFDQPDARGLTAANPGLDPFTRTTVAISTVRAAVQTPTFAGGPGQPAGFQSAKTPNHSAQGNEGILEGQPHDNVHGALGGAAGAGFMVSMMSSVDPIFFLHHGNLDRLWDVWTRRQTALGRPTMPQGADLTAWSDEQFLFFSNSHGQPVTKTKAGDYASMSAFDYDYSPGSGEDLVPATVVAAAAQFSAQITASAVGGAQPAGGVVQVPSSALQVPPIDTAPALVADVTLNLGHNDTGRRFNVLVSTPGGGPQVSAGAITVFGHPGHGPTTFVVPLPESVRTAAASAGGTVPLDVRVVPIGRTAAVAAVTAAAKAQATQAAGPLPLVAGITVRTN